MHSRLYHAHKLNILITHAVLETGSPHKYDFLNLSMQKNSCSLSFIIMGELSSTDSQQFCFSFLSTLKDVLTCLYSPFLLSGYTLTHKPVLLYSALKEGAAIFPDDTTLQLSLDFFTINVFLSSLAHIIAGCLSFPTLQAIANPASVALSWAVSWGHKQLTCGQIQKTPFCHPVSWKPLSLFCFLHVPDSSYTFLLLQVLQAITYAFLFFLYANSSSPFPWLLISPLC